MHNPFQFEYTNAQACFTAAAIGAGGVITTWDGKPAHNGGRIVAAGDKRVHEAALKILNS